MGKKSMKMRRGGQKPCTADWECRGSPCRMQSPGRGYCYGGGRRNTRRRR